MALRMVAALCGKAQHPFLRFDHLTSISRQHDPTATSRNYETTKPAEDAMTKTMSESQSVVMPYDGLRILPRINLFGAYISVKSISVKGVEIGGTEGCLCRFQAHQPN
ncbi:uncharacterized protein RCC_05662 [Ramularia collo-cygni]|uniref:Uncharacterized protein n=1 Tax=Ramularia collo-cygni TaxID=112498 RepID=A0A2D3V872_9PEZI|nr:uncharacterized protein RCC_05662 [Ramularia collo-cygni]CZT19806.1 uncharacterized protein RCC_05662 [Ramularia collo-cygni]